MNPRGKNLYTLFMVTAMVCCALFPPGCDIFETDGAEDGGIVTPKGYFYLIDRTTKSLIMLDERLTELKRWDASVLIVDSTFSLQGITCDGKYLWVSASGNTDQIIRVDATRDSLVKLRFFDAPPSRQGTIRGLAWDGINLWAVNSGSTTYLKPPKAYKLNPLNGAILGEWQLPTHDPRGLVYIPGYSDIYGRTADSGLIYTDVATDKIYRLLPELSTFDTVFTSPIPPRGASYNSPVGITYDGMFYWLVNSSISTAADHLYKLSYTGREQSRFDLPYTEPGSIVYTTVDVRRYPTPTVTVVSPNTGVAGRSLTVDVFGNEFVNSPGLSVSFGSGIIVDSLTYISATQVRAYVTIDSAASAGKRDVVVTNPGGGTTTGDDLFEVTLTPAIYNIWLVEQDLDSLYHIRFADTAAVIEKWNTRSIAAGGSPQGLAYDGTDIWLCASGADRKLYKLNTSGSSLSVIKTIPGPTPSGTLRGIAWEGGSLWVVVSAIGASARIYRVEPDSGKVLDSLSAPGIEPRGIAFANGQMYCNDITLDSVYVYDAPDQEWRGVFATPTPPGGTTTNRFATGMTWDGENFWIANSSNDFDHVIKVSPGGIMLQYFASPRIGLAQITGIVYTPN